MKLKDDSLGFLLTDVSRLMRRAFQNQIEGASALTLAQARALAHVSRREGLRQVELADLLEVQPITLARLVDQLEERGLIERRADPSDRRAYRLYLLPAAGAQLTAIKKAADANFAAAMKGVAKDQAETAVAVLKKMRENLTTR